MVKIKYIGISNSMNSKGIQYFKDTIYDVKDEVAEYFKKNFNSSFEIVGDIKVVEETPKVEEPLEKVVKTRSRKKVVKVEKD